MAAIAPLVSDRFAAVLGAARGRDPRDHLLTAVRPSEEAYALIEDLLDELAGGGFDAAADVLNAHVRHLRRPVLTKLHDAYVRSALADQMSRARVDVEDLLESVGVTSRYDEVVVRHGNTATLHLATPNIHGQPSTVCGRRQDHAWRPARRGAWAREKSDQCKSCRGHEKQFAAATAPQPDGDLWPDIDIRRRAIAAACMNGLRAFDEHVAVFGHVPRDTVREALAHQACLSAWFQLAAELIASGAPAAGAHGQMGLPAETWRELLEQADSQSWKRTEFAAAVAARGHGT